MKTYNWQQSDWPHFRYDVSTVSHTVLAIAEKTGLLNGELQHLTEKNQIEAKINLVIEEAIKTSAIEGEHISRLDVRSSIKNQLGLSQKRGPVHDKRAQGISELLLNVRHTFAQPLSETTLFDWHLMLMSGLSGVLRVGTWRTDEEPMQIVSERQGRWIVHYEAPPSQCIPEEMDRFIHWFNESALEAAHSIQASLVRAAIAHLYFESIHPFDDGNGRIGRAIVEKALSQGLGCPVIFSLSAAIESEKKTYYAALKVASRSNEITPWIAYFLHVILHAQIEAEKHIHFIFRKTKFFDKYHDVLNERQLKVIKRMMQAGIQGFEGGMSAKKYMKIADTSKATATRDLQHLFSINAFKQIGSGRSVRYELNL